MDNERLAHFWTHIDEDARIERFLVKENADRWVVFTNVRSIEDQEQLRRDMVDGSGLRPDQFEILFSE